MNSVEYLAGVGDGAARENELHRIEVFGAIRRAARIAREHDQRAAFYARDVLQNATPEGLNYDDRLLHVEAGAQSIWNHVTSARAVRQAIRAAIESDGMTDRSSYQ